jgi:hypothetical protein
MMPSMPDRATATRGLLAMLAVSAIALLFIASYAGALHEPRPHEVPIAVTAHVPAALTARLDASDAFDVTRVPDATAANRRLEHRDDYGALVTHGRSVELLVSQAHSASVAVLLAEELVPQLRRAGVTVTQRVAHPLPEADGRGLVAFYTAVGWVVAGYLGATLFGLAFGTSPGRRNLLHRLGGLVGLGLVTGLLGALIAGAIGDWPHGLLTIWLLGALTIVATGAATVAFQSLLGMAGTGLAILVFVILGNPAAGGAYPAELLPGFWRTLGPLLPNGAATTGVSSAAYFPHASIGGPLLVLLAWTVAGTALAVATAGRGRPMSVAEQEASVAAAAGA